MSEEQNKKISYKILTGEEIFQDTSSSAKEITSQQEKPSQEAQPQVSQPEIFYQKPIVNVPPKSVSEKKEKIPFKFNLQYLLIFGGAVLVLLIIVLSVRFVLGLRNKKSNQVTNSSQSQIEIPTVTVVTLELNNNQQTESANIPEETSASEEEISETTTGSELIMPTSQPTSTTSKESQDNDIFEEITEENIYPTKDIYFPGIIQPVQKKDFNVFIARQESFGTKLNVNLLDGEEKVPVNFLYNYFLKSENSRALLNEFTGNYGFVIYYGYLRRYPVLVFEIKNPDKVIKINQEWEKTTMKQDLKTLFLNFEPPETTNTFQTKTIEDFSYRILDFGDNYKIMWGVKDNYLIYSATEQGFQEIIKYL